ncbi:hypothetical protein [Phenylobacterium sp. SCN 70-31]|uniref:hypothetical protein n=1 Tax=Phenylobacterium sp. SCN 70-31 TaxID=1660129 RepID=UPI0025EFF8B8|nr:hypothetical protein [Phenylobacterium sp. SCN 70-31]
MPSDVPVELIAPRTVTEQLSPRRLPVGIGLTVGACASVALWTVIAFGVRALFA